MSAIQAERGVSPFGTISRCWMANLKYTVTIDVPLLADGIAFYTRALGFIEDSRPFPTYAVLRNGDVKIGIMEKEAGSRPAKGSNDIRRYDRHWTPVHIDFHPDDFNRTVSDAERAGAVIEERFEGGDHPPVAFCSDPFGNGFCIIGKQGH